MEEKDIFLNMLSGNIETNVDDMIATGKTITLQDKDEYLKNEEIKGLFIKKDTEKFDEESFNKVYDSAQEYANIVAMHEYNASNAATTIVDNAITRSWGVDTVKNPISYTSSKSNQYGQTIGGVGINEASKKTITADELAQNVNWYKDAEGNKVKADLTGGLNSLFNPTLALAQYDEDIKDSEGNVIHKKGEYKIDEEEGTFFYEELGGKDPSGKRILTLSNSLTDEGTWLNKYDFFDSDGVDKHIAGVIAKTAASVIPMFIPYVGTAYGLTLASKGLVDAGIEAYKAVDGLVNNTEKDDYAVGNEIQGTLEKIFGGTMSEKGQEGFISLEMLGNVVGSIGPDLGAQKALALLPAQIKYLSKAENLEKIVKAKGFKKALTSMDEVANVAGDPKKLQESLGSIYNQIGKIGKASSYIYSVGVASKEISDAADILGVETRDRSMMVLTAASLLAGLYRVAPWERVALKGLGIDDQSQMIKGGIRNSLSKVEGLNLKMASESAQETTGKAMRFVNTAFKGISKQFDSASKGVTVGGAATAEALEESSEVFINEGIKEFYNAMNVMGYTTTEKDKNKRFKFDSEQFLQELTLSALGGSIGGAAFRMSSPIESFDNVTMHQLVGMGMKDKAIEHIEKRHSKGLLASTEFSLEVDKDKSGIQYKKAKEGDYTHNDFVRDVFKRQLDLLDFGLNELDVNKNELKQIKNKYGEAFLEAKMKDDKGNEKGVTKEVVNNYRLSFLNAIGALSIDNQEETESGEKLGKYTSIEQDIFEYTSKIKKLNNEISSIKKSESSNDPIAVSKVKKLEKERDNTIEEFNEIKKILDDKPSEKADYYFQQANFSINSHLYRGFGVKTRDDFAENYGYGSLTDLQNSKKIEDSEKIDILEKIEEDYQIYARGNINSDDLFASGKSQDMRRAFNEYLRLKETSNFTSFLKEIKEKNIEDIEKSQKFRNAINIITQYSSNIDELKNQLESIQIDEKEVLQAILFPETGEEINRSNLPKSILDYAIKNEIKVTPDTQENFFDPSVNITGRKRSNVSNPIFGVRSITEDKVKEILDKGKIDYNEEELERIFKTSKKLTFTNYINTDLSANLDIAVSETNSYKDFILNEVKDDKTAFVLNQLLKIDNKRNATLEDSKEALEENLSKAKNIEKSENAFKEIKSIMLDNNLDIKSVFTGLPSADIIQKLKELFEKNNIEKFVRDLKNKSYEDGINFVDTSGDLKKELEDKKKELRKYQSFLIATIYNNPVVNQFRKNSKYVPDNLKNKKEFVFSDNTIDSIKLANPINLEINNYLYEIEDIIATLKNNERYQYKNLLESTVKNLSQQGNTITEAIQEAKNKGIIEEQNLITDYTSKKPSAINVFNNQEVLSMNIEVKGLANKFMSLYNENQEFKKYINDRLSKTPLKNIDVNEDQYDKSTKNYFLNSLIRAGENGYQEFQSLYLEILETEDIPALLQGQELVLFDIFSFLKNSKTDVILDNADLKEGKVLLRNMQFVNGIPGAGKSFLSRFIKLVNAKMHNRKTGFSAPGEGQVNNLKNNVGIEGSVNMSTFSDLFESLGDVLPTLEDYVNDGVLFKEDNNYVIEKYDNSYKLKLNTDNISLNDAEIREKAEHLINQGISVIILDEITNLDYISSKKLDKIIEIHNEVREEKNEPLLKVIQLGDSEQIEKRASIQFKGNIIDLDIGVTDNSVLTRFSPKLTFSIRNSFAYIPETIQELRKSLADPKQLPDELPLIPQNYWEGTLDSGVYDFVGVYSTTDNKDFDVHKEKIRKAMSENEGTTLIHITTDTSKNEFSEFGNRVRVMHPLFVQGLEADYVVYEDHLEVKGSNKKSNGRDHVSNYYTLLSRAKKTVIIKNNEKINDDINLSDVLNLQPLQKDTERDFPKKNITLGKIQDQYGNEINVAEQIKTFRINTLIRAKGGYKSETEPKKGMGSLGLSGSTPPPPGSGKFNGENNNRKEDTDLSGYLRITELDEDGNLDMEEIEKSYNLLRDLLEKTEEDIEDLGVKFTIVKTKKGSKYYTYDNDTNFTKLEEQENDGIALQVSTTGRTVTISLTDSSNNNNSKKIKELLDSSNENEIELKPSQFKDAIKFQASSTQSKGKKFTMNAAEFLNNIPLFKTGIFNIVKPLSSNDIKGSSFVVTSPFSSYNSIPLPELNQEQVEQMLKDENFPTHRVMLSLPKFKFGSGYLASKFGNRVSPEDYKILRDDVWYEISHIFSKTNREDMLKMMRTALLNKNTDDNELEFLKTALVNFSILKLSNEATRDRFANSLKKYLGIRIISSSQGIIVKNVGGSNFIYDATNSADNNTNLGTVLELLVEIYNMRTDENAKSKTYEAAKKYLGEVDKEELAEIFDSRLQSIIPVVQSKYENIDTSVVPVKDDMNDLSKFQVMGKQLLLNNNILFNSTSILGGQETNAKNEMIRRLNELFIDKPGKSIAIKDIERKIRERVKDQAARNNYQFPSKENIEDIVKSIIKDDKLQVTDTKGNFVGLKFEVIVSNLRTVSEISKVDIQEQTVDQLKKIQEVNGSLLPKDTIFKNNITEVNGVTYKLTSVASPDNLEVNINIRMEATSQNSDSDNLKIMSEIVIKNQGSLSKEQEALLKRFIKENDIIEELVASDILTHKTIDELIDARC